MAETDPVRDVDALVERLAELEKDLQPYAHKTLGSIRIDLDEVRAICGAATTITALQADVARLREGLAEMTRRRDGWKGKAEGFDTIRDALREKVGAPWPPNLSRALWAGLAADEKKRAGDAEADVARLREVLGETIDALEGRIDDLDQVICCSGHDCGCRGSSNRDLLIHDARAALRPQP